MSVFVAIADPVRRGILRILVDGPQRVVDIQRLLAARHPISRPAVSRHLRVLAEAGLVEAATTGRERHYRLDPTPLLEVRKLLSDLGSGDAADASRVPIAESALDALNTEVYRTRRHIPPDTGARMTNAPIPSGRHRVRRDGDVVEFTRTYRAAVDDVWAAVTESDRLARWIGFFDGDPDEGHVAFTMNAEGEENMTPVRYDIRRCEPPHVLQVHTTDDAGTWDLILELDENSGITTLRLSQIVHDPEVIESTGPGWEYYLDRLSAVVTGTDPADLDFDDYYPAQREYYLTVRDRVNASANRSPDSGY